MENNHWQRYPAQWGQVQAPLRVNGAIVAAFRAALAQAQPASGPALLLGMTPELLPLFDDLDVVDRNPAMLQALWHGSHPGQQAHALDWLAFTGRSQPYQVIAGDGSLNNAHSEANLHDIVRHAWSLLAPGGYLLCRLFERPPQPFTQERLKAALSGQVKVNFHAFKWMMAMYLAHIHGMRVPVQHILALFEALCPDVDQLASQTGWSLADIQTIHVYAGSFVAYVFPSREEVMASLPAGLEPRFLSSGQYDLSGCCPLMLCHKPVEAS
jgi:hypothetical protein